MSSGYGRRRQRDDDDEEGPTNTESHRSGYYNGFGRTGDAKRHSNNSSRQRDHASQGKMRGTDGYYRAGNTVDQEVANNIRDNVQRINSMGFSGRKNQMRRVNAAQGLDPMQRYDPFGKNSMTSADNPWLAFFGSPSQPWKTTSYDKYDRHNYNLPEAYIGKNLTLAQTIDELIYTDETFYTSVLLPFNFTDQLSVQWDKWEFNEHFTGIVPEQGVSRLVSSHREARSESFVRKGLAAIFEHGFIETPEGRANYFLTMAQIARAVKETLNFGVIYAYLTCHNYNKTWEERHGYFRKQTLREMLERENFMWAIAVKTEFGMEKLDAQIVEWMNRYRVTADTWILPPKPAMYLRLVPEEKVYYYKAGEEGPRRVNDIVGAGRPHESNAPNKRLHDIVEPIAVFKRNNVYLSRTYHVDKTGPIDLMSRTSSVGEYFKIVNTLSSHDFEDGFMSCDMDCRIYNETDDQGFTVTGGEWLRYNGVFDEDGRGRTPSNNEAPTDAADMHQVFFLRGETNREGTLVFKPIDWMGDISHKWFRPEDAVNLARTAAHKFSPAKREQLAAALQAGLDLIMERAQKPLTDVDGGAVTWEALRADANATIVAFRTAMTEVTNRLGNVFGGNSNLFLNPANSGGAAGAKSRERTLYESAFGFHFRPVFQQTYVQDAAGRTNAGANSAELIALREGIEFFRSRGLKAPAGGATPEYTTFEARIAAFGSGTLEEVRESYEGIKDEFLANPQFTVAKNDATLRVWLKQTDEKIFKAARAPLRAGQTRVADVTYTNTAKAVPADRELTDAETAAGYVLGTAWTPSQVETKRFTDAVDPAGAFSPVLLNEGIDFMALPMIRALIQQEEGASEAMGRVAAEYGGRFGTGAGSAGGEGRGMHDYMDYEDEMQSAGAAGGEGGVAPVGRMFGVGRSGRLDREAVDQLAAGVNFVPDVGTDFDAPINVRFGNMAMNLQLMSKYPQDALYHLIVALHYGTPWRRQSLESYYNNNVMLPVGCLGFRWGFYEMALGIKCKAGGETGYTYFGHSDFMLADDAAIKVHYGHYTHYGKSVIHREENVFIAYDIFPNKCLGGMGITPYTDRNQYDPSDEKYERDIFYLMVPFAERDYDKVMSAAGRFYTYMDNGMLDQDDPANQELHYSTAPYYCREWGWYSDESISQELDEPTYRVGGSQRSLNIWQGAQGYYNRAKKDFTRDIIRNKSPWGPNVGEGCRAARNGEMERIPRVPYGVLGF